MLETLSKNVTGRSGRWMILAAMVLGLMGFLTGCATFTGKKESPVTVAEVVTMSQNKMPADQIIDKMQTSGTVYRLKASELVDLKDKGVSDDVLNYMQQTYLEAVRRDQAYEDWNRWTMGVDGYWYGGRAFGWPY